MVETTEDNQRLVTEKITQPRGLALISNSDHSWKSSSRKQQQHSYQLEGRSLRRNFGYSPCYDPHTT